MRRKRNLYYEVGNFGGYYWNPRSGKWINMNAQDRPKVGYSISDVRCYTKKRAFRHVLNLLDLTDKEIYCYQYYYKNGERWCRPHIWNASRSENQQEN